MARIKYETDATQAVRAQKALTKAQEDYNKEVDKTPPKMTKAERAAKGLAAQADPQEKYNQKMRKLAEAVEKGGLDIDRARGLALKYQQQLDRAGESGQRAFGPTALRSLQSYAAGFLSVGAAVQAVTAYLREQAAERDKALQGSKQAVSGEGSLAQLAVTQGTTLEERKAAHARLLAESRGAFAQGAYTDRNEAANDTFGLNSAGLSDADRQFAYDVRWSNALSNVGDAGRAYSALSKALGGQEVGTFEDFLDKAIAASALAPAQADQIPLAATRAGGSAKALGISDEFLLAASALLAGKTGSAELGGTQLASFLKQVEKAAASDENEFLRGKSGIELVKAIADLPEAQQTYGGVLGDRSEAVEGFRTLRDNLAVLEKAYGDIGRAQSEDLAKQSIAVALSDPNTRAAILQRQKENQLELSQLDAATNNLLFEAGLDERKRIRRERAAAGDGLDRAAAGASVFLEDTQVNLETLFGLRDAAEWKKKVQAEILSEGEIRDRELANAIRENTEAVRANTGSPTTRQE